MIKIASTYIETPMELDSASPLVLIEENTNEFYRVVTAFLNAFNGEAAPFTFWAGDKSILPSKQGEILNDFFTFDFVDKKIINLLYKTLQSNFLNGEFIVQFGQINTNVLNFLENLCSTVDFSLDYNEISVEELLKICQVKPSKTYDTVLEKIVCYINIFVSLKNVSFFVFVDIKSILSDEELISLYKHCALHKVSLLLIESTKRRERLDNERTIIITEDLCEITEGLKCDKKVDFFHNKV